MSCLIPAFAQKPDDDAIFAAVMDAASPYYYPTLMMRYDAGDTTLTHDDYRHLYYGYAFQDEYRPLEPTIGEGEILSVFDRNPEPGPVEAERIIHYARQVMEQDPFSPKNINFMIYAYGVLGDSINERINADRLRKILEVIDSSGTGLKEGSPWHVLWFSHVNDFLGSRGLEILRRRVVERSVEYVTLTEPDGRNKGYYFDFGRVYWKKPENLPEKRVDGIKFENFGPKYRGAIR